MPTTWTESMTQRAEELLESSPLFAEADKGTFNGAMRDIKKLAASQDIPLVEAAASYIKSCEQSHTNELRKRDYEEGCKILRATGFYDDAPDVLWEMALKQLEIIAHWGEGRTYAEAARNLAAGLVDQKHPPQVAFAGGAALSSKIPPLHLIPTISLEELAERCRLGIERKGEKAWNAMSNNQQVLFDQDFILERISHVIFHAMKLRDVLANRDVDTLENGDNHASAIMWGGMFLICAKNALIQNYYDSMGGLERVSEDEEHFQHKTSPYAKADRPGEDEHDEEDEEEVIEPLNVNVSPFAHVPKIIMDELRKARAEQEHMDKHAIIEQTAQIEMGMGITQWVAVPIYELSKANEMMYTSGYRVRYYHTAPDGSWLFVREYKCNPDGGEPSIAWCEYAAKRDAQEFNEKVLPPNYFVEPYQKWMDTALKNTFGLEKQ